MRKGFTLIELLAVIVILAIIALIAVPIVLGIIDDAKKSSVVRSGEFYIKGLELAIICLAWIVIFPFAIIQMKKNNEEE